MADGVTGAGAVGELAAGGEDGVVCASARAAPRHDPATSDRMKVRERNMEYLPHHGQPQRRSPGSGVNH